MMMTAMTPRTVLIIGVVSLSAGWLLGSSTSSHQPDPPAVRGRSAVRPLGSSANVAPFTRQLRERLDSPPRRSPAVGRNPFVFGTRRPAAVARRTEEPLPAPEPAPMPPPPAPQFRLSGIASSEQHGAPVLTAIMTDNGALVFVKTGDALSNGFSVVRVELTGVVIVDAAGVTQTVRLP